MGGSCEPLRIWSRLEPRPRQTELDRPMRARIHDPLWMLTRQWQFGEFHGEDTGSAIAASIARRISPIARFRVGDAAVAADEPYEPSRPLEARVERLTITFPPAVRQQAGRTFTALLAARLPDSTRAAARRHRCWRRFRLPSP